MINSVNAELPIADSPTKVQLEWYKEELLAALADQNSAP